MDLDFMPSPIEDRPGLLIRDSFQYSDATLIIPPALAPCLQFFDGAHAESDLRAALVELTGELQVSPLIDHLRKALSEACFLHDENFAAARENKHEAFRASPHRDATHAGSAYPATADGARTTIGKYMEASTPNWNESLIGIAAPHVSPFGGWQSYRDAYGALNDSYRDRVFVILGTSHYGEPDRFGLTRKDFVTPYGAARTEQRLVSELAAEPAALMEDYCHAIEHSIEFQVVFLQHLFGPDIRVLPVLCGSFARGFERGALPEDDEGVRRFLGRLGEIGAREGKSLFWVLGIDMAHMGIRYQDPAPARANRDEMLEVAARDQERIARANLGDAAGFWELARVNGDDLKWCGSSPLYAFLRAAPEARGTLRRYEQWNIDEDSVVSFAGITFE